MHFFHVRVILTHLRCAFDMVKNLFQRINFPKDFCAKILTLVKENFFDLGLCFAPLRS
jgi:hypothetical protein